MTRNAKGLTRGFCSALLRRLADRRTAADGATIGHRQYDYDESHVVVADFAEYASMPLDAVIAGIRQFQQLVQGEWRGLGASSFEEASKIFYSRSQSYVFDLLSANFKPDAVVEKLDRFSPRILKAMALHRGKRYLEFGGGLGIMCEIAHRHFDKEVTYLDIPGRISDFALWRFRRHGLPIQSVIISPGDSIEGLGKFDIVFTDGVLEHMSPREQLRVTESLASRTAPNGVLVMLVDIRGPTQENPTHEHVDIVALHSALTRSGLANQYGRNKFCSIWQR